MAHVWSPPDDIATAVLFAPRLDVGVGINLLMVVPSKPVFQVRGSQNAIFLKTLSENRFYDA